MVAGLNNHSTTPFQVYSQRQPELALAVVEDDRLDIDFAPLGDWLLIEPHVAEKGQARTGSVIRSGPGAYNGQGVLVPQPVAVGDIIYLMTTVEPLAVNLEGHDLYLIRARDMIGKLESSI